MKNGDVQITGDCGVNHFDGGSLGVLLFIVWVKMVSLPKSGQTEGMMMVMRIKVVGWLDEM